MPQNNFIERKIRREGLRMDHEEKMLVKKKKKRIQKVQENFENG